MGRPHIFNVLWIGALVFLLGILVLYVGPTEVAAALSAAEPRFIGLALGAYLAFFVLRGARWRLLLREVAPGTTVAAASGLTAGGWLVSTFVPLKAGDVSRAAVLARRERSSLVAVGGTIAIERALDVVGLALLASAGLAAVAALGPALPSALGGALALAWTLPLLGLGLLFLAARHVPHHHRNVLFRVAARFLEGVRGLRANPRRIPPLLAMTVLATAFQSLVFASLYLALRPGASLLLAASVSPLFLLSFAFAVTPGHVGTYEAAFVFVYGLLGSSPAELAPIAVACHILGISLVALLGTIGLASLRFSMVQAPIPAPLEEATP